MNFLAPGAFILGLLLPVIVALYLLKLRRVEKEVPSTYLWVKMVRDVEANAPWQRLRPNLLMILQLLFLAALILALSRPFVWAEGASGDAAIFILDASASMLAADVESADSRLDSAKKRAVQLVDDLPDTARVTIIEAGREARVLLSSSLDRRQAHLAIESIKAWNGGSDLGVALELGSAIAARQPGTEIVVLSDGRVTLPQRLVLKGRLRYIPFGLSGENQAISLLTLEQAPGNTLTAFIQVTNYGTEPAARRLSLFTDGNLENVYNLSDIPPGGQKNVIAEGLNAETRLVEARLDGKDILDKDDKAVAVKPDTRPLPVRLATQGNLFLETALSLQPGVVLTEQAVAADAEASASETGEQTPEAQPTAAGETAGEPAALIIYDGYVPDLLPASGSLVFIAPQRSTDLFTTTGGVNTPQPRAVDPADPLLANVSISAVSILDAVQIPLPEWAVPVVEGDLVDENGNPTGENVPLIFRGEVGGRRVVVIAFDLRRSDLPLQVAFPLLWSNIVDWLAPGGRSSVPPQAAPGETITFSAGEGVSSAVITRPNNASVEVQAENGRFVYAGTEDLGVYQIQFGGEQAQDSRPAAFAVNLFSPSESNLDPADNLPGVASEDGPANAASQRAMHEWWRPLALLALGLLAGEWLVYQRGALARIRDLIFRRGLPASKNRHTTGW